jgi:mRNA interferase MazF
MLEPTNQQRSALNDVRGALALGEHDSAQGKAQSALIIQNDIGNYYSPVLIVATLTSGETARNDVQVEVKVPAGGLQRNSLVLLNQIRTIDKQRVGRYWGPLSAQTMQRVDRAIRISLGLVPV